MQDEENGEQEVEDVVGGKHLEQIVNEILKQATIIKVEQQHSKALIIKKGLNFLAIKQLLAKLKRKWHNNSGQ